MPKRIEIKKLLILFVILGSLPIWGNTVSRSSNAGPQAEITIQKIPIEIGDSRGISKVGDIIIYKNTLKPYPVYINLHDDENVSAEAALRTIKKYSGTLIELKHKNVRRVSFEIGLVSYDFDPNRIFSLEGIKNTLNCKTPDSIIACEKLKAEKETAKFADKLKNLLLKYINPKAQLIIGIHNNTVGGGLTIAAYKDDPEFNSEAQEDFVTGKLLVNNVEGTANVDYFYLATERNLYDWLLTKKEMP